MHYNSFSVIIPTYNRANLLSISVGSVLSQEYPNFELIVIDDGSTDNTKEIIDRIADNRIIYFKQNNAGRCSARNKGIELANNKWVCMLDSDDEFFPNHLSVLNDLINNNVSYNVFATDQTIQGELRQYFNKAYYKSSYIIRFKDFIYTNPLALNQICFNKEEVLTRFYDKEDIPISEDWLFFRELTLNHNIYKSNIVTNNVQLHEARSVNTIKVELFAYYNNYTALLFIQNNKLSQLIKNKILSNNYLMCANILLSSNKNAGIKYLLKSLNFFETFFNILLYKGIIKVILLKFNKIIA